MVNQTGTRRDTPWLSIGSLYLAGMLQGLTLVSFPASSAVLKQMHGFSDAQYGAIFLPQVALAVIGALGGGALAARLGLKALLGGALLINAVSQLLLAGSMLLPPAAAFVLGTARHRLPRPGLRRLRRAAERLAAAVFSTAARYRPGGAAHPARPGSGNRAAGGQSFHHGRPLGRLSVAARGPVHAAGRGHVRRSVSPATERNGRRRHPGNWRCVTPCPCLP